jgi:hypothetical protein
LFKLLTSYFQDIYRKFLFVFPGSYQFKLAVKDKDNNEDSNFVSVTVTQDSNAAPVAQAGTDVEVILPQSVVIGDLFFLCYEKKMKWTSC